MHTGRGAGGRFSWAIAVVLYFIMKTASKVAIILLVAGVVLVAAQEGPRTYVADCICCLCSYLFSNS